MILYICVGTGGILNDPHIQLSPGHITCGDQAVAESWREIAGKTSPGNFFSCGHVTCSRCVVTP